MKKLIGGVKWAFSSGSCSGDGSQDSARSSSFMPLPHSRLAHALVMDHKTLHGLHPSCLYRMRPVGRSAILHTMTFLWPRTTTTFPSVAPRRWRSMSFSASERLVTLVYTLWTCSRGLEWKKSFLSSSRLLVGENSTEGIGLLKQRMGDFATVQSEMQASLDSQASMMDDFFGHFGN
jgi:hypothetical protein